MEKKLTFNQNTENYETYRPGYSSELFEAVFAYASLPPDAHILEIGCGTGKATAPFLEKNYQVTAVELGDRLAAFVRKKYADYSRFAVCNMAFEDFPCDADCFDMAVSATAFHWIPPESGFPKVYRLLKPNGAVALFWNKAFVCNESDPLHRRIQELYGAYFSAPAHIPRHSATAAQLAHYGFCDVQTADFYRTRMLSAEQYIQLIDTYSDHHLLPEKEKQVFYSQIRSAILDAGNIIQIQDRMDLYLGRKPAL